MFFEISQNSQENISARDFLIKLQALGCNFIKKESVALMFFCEFCQFIRTPFLKQPLWWLLLIVLLWFRSCKLISLNFFSIVVNIFTQHTQPLQNWPSLWRIDKYKAKMVLELSFGLNKKLISINKTFPHVYSWKT